jgi:hypothetical protein
LVVRICLGSSALFLLFRFGSQWQAFPRPSSCSHLRLSVVYAAAPVSVRIGGRCSAQAGGNLATTSNLYRALCASTAFPTCARLLPLLHSGRSCSLISLFPAGLRCEQSRLRSVFWAAPALSMQKSAHKGVSSLPRLTPLRALISYGLNLCLAYPNSQDQPIGKH